MPLRRSVAIEGPSMHAHVAITTRDQPRKRHARRTLYRVVIITTVAGSGSGTATRTTSVRPRRRTRRPRHGEDWSPGSFRPGPLAWLQVVAHTPLSGKGPHRRQAHIKTVQILEPPRMDAVLAPRPWIDRSSTAGAPQRAPSMRPVAILQHDPTQRGGFLVRCL